jgi:hypothetical protein
MMTPRAMNAAVIGLPAKGSQGEAVFLRHHALSFEAGRLRKGGGGLVWEPDARHS